MKVGRNKLEVMTSTFDASILVNGDASSDDFYHPLLMHAVQVMVIPV